MRVYSQQVYGIPPEQVVGSAGATRFGYDKDGKPFLAKEPKLLRNNDNVGKPEGIHLMIGRRPHAAFGNSTGDRQMLEWTAAGTGMRLKMLVLHDDAEREYSYGPALGLPDSKVGTFTSALYEEAKKNGWSGSECFRSTANIGSRFAQLLFSDLLPCGLYEKNMPTDLALQLVWERSASA